MHIMQMERKHSKRICLLSGTFIVISRDYRREER